MLQVRRSTTSDKVNFFTRIFFLFQQFTEAVYSGKMKKLLPASYIKPQGNADIFMNEHKGQWGTNNNKNLTAWKLMGWV